MRNTGTPGISRDLRAMIRNAVEEARALTLQGKSIDHIPDELLWWLLSDGNKGNGWGGERVRFPKFDAISRRQKIEKLLADDFSSTAIGEIVGLPASTVRTITQEIRGDKED